MDEKENSQNDLISWYTPDDKYEVDSMENGDFEDIDLDRVYKKLYTIDDLHEVERIIKQKSIINIVPTYKPKKFLYESYNDEDNATIDDLHEVERIIKQKSIERTASDYRPRKFLYEDVDNKLKLIFVPNNNDELIKGQELVFKANISWGSGDRKVLYADGGFGSDVYALIIDDTRMSKLSHDGNINLDSFKKRNYTITDNLKEFEELLGLIIRPTYRPRKFIYEKLDPKNNTLIFEPNNDRESKEAQIFAFKEGWVWGNGEKEVQYTNKDQGMFLTFSINYTGVKTILRIPQSHYDKSFDDVGNKMESLKRNVNSNIIYTNNLNNFKQKLSNNVIPLYKPKKFIY